MSKNAIKYVLDQFEKPERKEETKPEPKKAKRKVKKGKK